MSIYTGIKEAFGYDEPIFASDIANMFPDRSRPWVDKLLKTMVDNNQLKRFSTGVYYIPRKTLFGESMLSPQKVIVKKYIKNDTQTYGYVSGTALLNTLGLTTQVPNMLTVVTNNESTRGRKVSVGSQAVYLMKSSTEITKDNCATLQLLETAKLIDLYNLNEAERLNLEKYIEENNITLSTVSEYCPFFPDYVSKRVLGGGLIGKLARQ